MPYQDGEFDEILGNNHNTRYFKFQNIDLERQKSSSCNLEQVFLFLCVLQRKWIEELLRRVAPPQNSATAVPKSAFSRLFIRGQAPIFNPRVFVPTLSKKMATLSTPSRKNRPSTRARLHTKTAIISRKKIALKDPVKRVLIDTQISPLAAPSGFSFQIIFPKKYL